MGNRIFVLVLSVSILHACNSGGGSTTAAPPGPLSDNASLSSLRLAQVEFDQIFQPGVMDYTATVNFLKSSIMVNAVAEDVNASITVNGMSVASGILSDTIPLNVGSNVVSISITSQDGETSETFTIEVVRESLMTLAQRAYIKASNTNAGDLFGTSIALAGDTLIVGAEFEGSNATGVNGDQSDTSATTAGAAYVLTRDASGVWSQQAYVKASNTDGGDRFGTSVAFDGDTLAIGAPREDSSATGVDGAQSNNDANDAGAVYVFVRDMSGLWSQQAYIKASNAGAGDRFGRSVVLDGGTLVVGAGFEDSSATGVNGDQSNDIASNAGAAYVFRRDASGVWSQQAYLKASNTDVGDSFGLSVALDVDTLAVGAESESSGAIGINGNQSDDSTQSAGAVYVFTRSAGGTWSQQAYVKASNAGTTDLFGQSVAIDGNTLVVGAGFENSSATGVNGDQSDNSLGKAGAAYVFVRDATGMWRQQAYIKASNTDANDLFGTAVVLNGNMLTVAALSEYSSATGVNGDQADNSAMNAGAAYVFTRDASDTWSQQAFIKASNTGAGDLFGIAIALDDDTLVVSAYNEDSNATGVGGNQFSNAAVEAGAVYVFQ